VREETLKSTIDKKQSRMHRKNVLKIEIIKGDKMQEGKMTERRKSPVIEKKH
jgi:hypothetical protein